MDVTAIICTHNRCQDLAKILESLSGSKVPDSVSWEVLVVDNNSNDKTREVVQNFSDRYPGLFRYLFEPRPGKSYALNLGVREAAGGVLAFLDDDVVVESSWLHNLTSPLHGSEWAGVGGRTLPSTPFKHPRWFALEGDRGLGGVLCAFFDSGDEPCQLDRPPYGANMAFRKAMFEKYGGFRLDLGPSPNGDVPRPNEDTEFGRRLMAAGERIMYQPTAVAYHPVVEQRLKKSYFLGWWYDYGRADVRERGPLPGMWGMPRWVFSAWLTFKFSFKWMRTWDPKLRFWYKCWLWMMAGKVVENYRQWREEEPVKAAREPQ